MNAPSAFLPAFLLIPCQRSYLIVKDDKSLESYGLNAGELKFLVSAISSV